MCVWKGDESRSHLGRLLPGVWAEILSLCRDGIRDVWGDISVEFDSGVCCDRKFCGELLGICDAADQHCPCLFCESTVEEIRNLSLTPVHYNSKLRCVVELLSARSLYLCIYFHATLSPADSTLCSDTTAAEACPHDLGFYFWVHFLTTCADLQKSRLQCWSFTPTTTLAISAIAKEASSSTAPSRSLPTLCISF